MAVRETLTVSITKEQDDLLRNCLRTGRFASVSEAMRAALRLLERDEAAALAAIGEPTTHGRAARG